MKILVVDDNEHVGKAVMRLLKSYDHNVVFADDGKSALNKLMNE